MLIGGKKIWGQITNTITAAYINLPDILRHHKIGGLPTTDKLTCIFRLPIHVSNILKYKSSKEITVSSVWNWVCGVTNIKPKGRL